MMSPSLAWVVIPVLVGSLTSCAGGDATSANSVWIDTVELSSAAEADSPRDCDYFSADERFFRCASGYEAVSHFTSSDDDPACASFYSFSSSGTRYASFKEAAAGSGCDTTCIWHASTAVDSGRCGHRWGYTTLRADNQACPVLYKTDKGYYTSLEQYEAANPCP
ncbi:hypothetical protein [Sorangium sp. So ce1182]|uniref:hypothetical protein n=1 Tax=Sorangium sp. So ce1182 TaxID=3133334 RepID=UPI003F645433